MGAQENAEVARKVLEAMNAEDRSALDSLVADDVVWHYIGGTEPVRGKAAMASMMQDSGWSITTKVHDILASDDHAVMLVEATATRDAKTLQYRTAEICHIRDGKITERWAFSDDTARIVAFFA